MIEEILNSQKLRIEAGRRSLLLFAAIYFPQVLNSKTPQFHKQMCKLVDDESKTRLLFLMFRESAKTTFLKIKYIHNICYRTYRYQLFCCYDKRRAQSYLFDIVKQLQTNKFLIRDFGLLYDSQPKKESRKRAIGDFITTNEVKCQSFSIGESPRGLLYGAKDGEFRPDFWVLDDVDVLKAVENKAVIDKNWEWFTNELLAGVANNAKVVFLGNRVKSDGMIPRLEKKINVPTDILKNGYGLHSEQDWTYYSVPIELNNEILWPDKYSNDDLRKKQLDLGSFAYNSQMLNVISSGEKVFDVSDIKIETQQLQIGTMNIFMASDFAISEKKSADETVHIVVGVDKNNDIWVLDLFNERVNPKQSIDALIALHQKYKPIRYGMEVVSFQKSMKYALEDRMRSSGRYFKIDELKAANSKYQRILGLQPLVQMGKVHVKREIAFRNANLSGENILDQFDKFPNGQHDDIIDALAYILQLAFPTNAS